MSKDTNIIKSSREYTRSYTNMRGSSQLNSDKDDATERYGYTRNMYIDYASGSGAIESIPGFRRLFTLEGGINGLYSHKAKDGDFILIHSGNRLYKMKKEERDGGAPTLIYSALADTKSYGFTSGRNLCIADGSSIVLIDGDGALHSLSDKGGAYVPILFSDEEPYEERNLLTDAFAEQISIIQSAKHSYGSAGLIYQITSEAPLECRVMGSREVISGALYIPSYAKINGKRYKVTEIGDWAFSLNDSITELIISEGLKSISRYAFLNCTALWRVVLSDTVKSIGAYSFFGCTALKEFHIGTALEKFGSNSLSSCKELKEMTYGGDTEELALIGGQANLSGKTVRCNCKISSVRLALPVCSSAQSIQALYIDGEPFTGYRFSETESEIVIDLYDKLILEGKSVRIEGRLRADYAASTNGILSAIPKLRENPASAILGCKIGEYYDGRIFLSGNPSCPGVVFYSSTPSDDDSLPNYFSESSYFSDGGGSPLTAMLAVSDRLACFKSRDDGYGSVFYHKSEMREGGVAFPVTHTHGGISDTRAAFSFLDVALFLNSEGVFGLGIKSNGEGTVHARSSKISSLIDKYGECSFAEWQGYLVMLSGDKIFLADSRDKVGGSNSFEYEWYILEGIGCYKNDRRVYRYSSVAREGYHVSDTPDKRVTKTVMSVEEEDGSFVHYVEQGGKKFEVYPTEEFYGGDYYGAKAICSVGGLLFFGTGGGEVCVFNSDKRGVAPDYILERSDYDPESYKRHLGNQIHPAFYFFDRHAPLCAVKTQSDDCELPYLTKRTVSHSATLKFRSLFDGIIHTEVGTDTDGYSYVVSFPSSRLDFAELDFSRFTFVTDSDSAVSIPEKGSGWCEKEISVYSNEPRSPIGVYSIAYRYKIKGTIKNK